ncbi:ribulose 1,5-bisphosphate carboxylase [Lactonifactor longoviformis]|uniref:2,3-diketo-5-methylthiopentyl-1-phosphate enolase n=1 Tax=Lactonifactor longoviformis DSM 17459 TaxID=1122155 RepID=A0A1M4URP4_9CLOT|nr:RuBisCO large subunit C-terminal-like domain-containing protein [Lactonifactor longoviformis]POP31946.1 ribulose 1,5-bisphosphate carboxylase [Lactonifactor longoviformis]SHE59386.1 2,3-diketo-5-methylthiopentyl-1-phosphate enolase [Lactonifactor longoviformis DSM 17459]
MFVDPIIMQLPEEIDCDRFVIATYYAAGKPGTNMVKFAAALAVEQTCGTWLKVPGETPEVRERAIGRVLGVYEAPSHQIEIPEEVKERHFIIRIAYPWRNFDAQFSMMLSTVIGNISSSGKVKLVDLEFPKSFLENFKGPKFGVQGIREVLGVYDRPLLNNMIKPCIGLTPEKTAELAFEAAVGGVDVIKDDELVCSPSFCPLEDRVKAVMGALKKADEMKGEKTLYAFNITAPVLQMRENAYRAIEAGANALMINYASVGLDTTRVITEDPNINVPILGHSDYTGAQYESPWSGLSATLIGAKLPRLAGMDMVIALTPYGKFPMMMDTFVNMGLQLLAPMQHIKSVFPMPGGGTTQGHIEDVVKKFGNDVMIAAGGAIHGHPMGPKAGAKAFRQGIDAVCKGQSLAAAAKEYEELGKAVENWGIYEENRSGLFDLKG